MTHQDLTAGLYLSTSDDQAPRCLLSQAASTLIVTNSSFAQIDKIAKTSNLKSSGKQKIFCYETSCSKSSLFISITNVAINIKWFKLKDVIILALLLILTLPCNIAYGRPISVTKAARSVPSSTPFFRLSEIDGCRISNSEESQSMTNGVLPTILPSSTSPLLISTSATSYNQPQLNLTHPISIAVECQNITGEQLQEQLHLIRNRKIVKLTSLSIRDSNLTNLGNLPQSMSELKRLVFSNTSIDLEVLKEGSEALNQLSSLEILNEKISNIPQNFFQEMQSLKELRLENDEIASLDGDAFHNLDDSLEILTLRNNRFNRFPMAVTNLDQLTVLDLEDNDINIDTQDRDLPDKLEALIQLRELKLMRFNCTCEFGWSPFFDWIARTHISGVRCIGPEKFKSQEIIVLRRDELCEEADSKHSLTSSGSQSLLRLMIDTEISLIYKLICLSTSALAILLASPGRYNIF